MSAAYRILNAELAIEGATTIESLTALMPLYQSIVYFCCDAGTDTGLEGGFSALQSIATIPVQHLPVPGSNYSSSLAERINQIVREAPKPTLLLCKSARRAGLAAAIYTGILNNWSTEQVVEFANSHQLSFLQSPAMVDLALAGVGRARPKNPLVFRQFFEQESSTYTYLLADSITRDAIIIDPVDVTSDRDATFIREMDLNLRIAANTHLHADHITGTGRLKQLIPGTLSAIAAAANARGDIQLNDGDKIQFGTRYVSVRSTPGHTDGCLTYVLDDLSVAFTGDALLIRGCGRTDFQQGSSDRLFDSIHQRVFTLPQDTLIYPAHDYKGRLCSSVGEEKTHNPRLTKSKEEFNKIMAELNLPPPKKINEAVPANLVCGLFDLPPVPK